MTSTQKVILISLPLTENKRHIKWTANAFAIKIIFVNACQWVKHYTNKSKLSKSSYILKWTFKKFRIWLQHNSYLHYKLLNFFGSLTTGELVRNLVGFPLAWFRSHEGDFWGVGICAFGYVDTRFSLTFGVAGIICNIELWDGKRVTIGIASVSFVASRSLRFRRYCLNCYWHPLCLIV